MIDFLILGIAGMDEPIGPLVGVVFVMVVVWIVNTVRSQKKT